MPRYVILLANARYGREPGGRGAVEHEVHAWAAQFDVAVDERPTYGARGRVRPAGQRVMVRTVPYVSPDSADRSSEIWTETTQAYADAAGWAGPGGVVAILMDHGMRGIAHLAPKQQLPVSPPVLTLFELVRRGRIERARVEPSISRFEAIGDILRRHRVARLDILSCSVGVAAYGRELLDGLHSLWGIPVRALLGDFIAEKDFYSELAAAWVVPSGTRAVRCEPTAGSGFYRLWETEPPREHDIWQLSSPRAPAVDDEELRRRQGEP